MKIISTIFLILIISSFVDAKLPFDTVLVKKDSLNIEKVKISDEELLKILISISSQGDPWAQRKEIAAWAATVLFLTIIGLILLNYEKYKRFKILVGAVILFSFLLLWLFAHFINEQFGSVVHDIARRSIYVYELAKLSDGKIKVPLLFEDVLNIAGADSMKTYMLYKKIIKRLRSRGLKNKFFLPINHVYYRFQAYFHNESWRKESVKYWSKNRGDYQPSTLEMEEAIQYNLMMISYLFFTFFLVFLSFGNSIKSFVVKICKSLVSFIRKVI